MEKVEIYLRLLPLTLVSFFIYDLLSFLPISVWNFFYFEDLLNRFWAILYDPIVFLIDTLILGVLEVSYYLISPFLQITSYDEFYEAYQISKAYLSSFIPAPKYEFWSVLPLTQPDAFLGFLVSYIVDPAMKAILLVSLFLIFLFSFTYLLTLDPKSASGLITSSILGIFSSFYLDYFPTDLSLEGGFWNHLGEPIFLLLMSFYLMSEGLYGIDYIRNMVWEGKRRKDNLSLQKEIIKMSSETLEGENIEEELDREKIRRVRAYLRRIEMEYPNWYDVVEGVYSAPEYKKIAIRVIGYSIVRIILLLFLLTIVLNPLDVLRTVGAPEYLTDSLELLIPQSSLIMMIPVILLFPITSQIISFLKKKRMKSSSERILRGEETSQS
ncbi:MAG: hypothetical protein J7L50_01015 [Candidatus Odinarchaeota archaeon]|nr:hypothetical protein [Candidatus Odinarchaeota archaeon]